MQSCRSKKYTTIAVTLWLIADLASRTLWVAVDVESPECLSGNGENPV